MDIDNEQPKRKRGRPKKTDVISKSKGSRGIRGRPKGCLLYTSDAADE